MQQLEILQAVGRSNIANLDLRGLATILRILFLNRCCDKRGLFSQSFEGKLLLLIHSVPLSADSEYSLVVSDWKLFQGAFCQFFKFIGNKISSHKLH
ncbi:hypothetical protein A9978_26960 [Pseudomonas sp. UMC65]|nr:hypothetical protein [Pseudomonas sp. UMC65]MBB1620160.1 hypothetical protein [Pseudomonas sp. UME65]